MHHLHLPGLVSKSIRMDRRQTNKDLPRLHQTPYPLLLQGYQLGRLHHKPATEGPQASPRLDSMLRLYHKALDHQLDQPWVRTLDFLLHRLGLDHHLLVSLLDFSKVMGGDNSMANAVSRCRFLLNGFYNNIHFHFWYHQARIEV